MTNPVKDSWWNCAKSQRHNWEIVQDMSIRGLGGNITPSTDAMMKDAFSRKFKMVWLWNTRIGRNTKHLLGTVERLNEKSIDLYIHNQQIDTSTASGKLFFSISAVFAEFERNLIAERVKSGIANARNKKPNKSWGRKSNLTQETASEIVRLHKEEGIGKVRLSKQFLCLFRQSTKSSMLPSDYCFYLWNRVSETLVFTDPKDAISPIVYLCLKTIDSHYLTSKP